MFLRVLSYCMIPVALVVAWYFWDQGRVEVSIAAVEIGEAVDAIPAELTVEPELEMRVNAPFGGRVLRSFVQQGKRVRAGDPLFEIEASDRSAMTRTISATIDGILTEVDALPGEAIPPFAPLARLWNGRTLLVAHVPAKDFVGIDEGLDAEVRLPSTKPDEWKPARVMQVPQFAEHQGGDFRVRLAAELDDGRLRPGIVGKALIIRRRIPNSLLVPEAALQADGSVFVVKGTRVKKVFVETAHPFHGKRQVLSGLTTEDAVVESSAAPLENKTRIRLRTH